MKDDDGNTDQQPPSQEAGGLGDEESEFSFEAEYDFDDWGEIPEEEASRILRGLETLIPSIVKRSLGNVLNAEEGLRAIVGDKNIPKELAGFLLGQIDATRRGILRIVSNEIRVFLENVDFGGELAKILTTLSFEIKTEIRFVPNDERLRPSVRNSIKMRRNKDEPDADGSADEPAPPSEASDDPAPRKPASRWTRRKE